MNGAVFLSKRKGTKNHRIAWAVVLCVLVAVLGSGIFLVNFVLNKIDYDDDDTINNGMLDTIIDAESVTLPEGFQDHDNDLSQNANDTRMWYHDEIENTLLLGLDYADAEGKKYPRADAVILVSVNKMTNKINLVSLSRATYVSIPGYKNARLNAAYSIGGPSLMIKTVEMNYKIRIDNYASVNFEAFTSIIDILGGVEITLTEKECNGMRSALGSANKGAGTYNLNGSQALAYARLREIDSDRDRTQRQQRILLSIADKAKGSMSVDVIMDLINQILPLVKTDFTKMELISQAVSAPGYLKWPITQTLIPTKKPVSGENFLLIENSEVILLDWPETRNQLHELLYPGVELAQPLEKSGFLK